MFGGQYKLVSHSVCSGSEIGGVAQEERRFAMARLMTAHQIGMVFDKASGIRYMNLAGHRVRLQESPPGVKMGHTLPRLVESTIMKPPFLFAKSIR
jgi:hypothetical protein